MKIFTLAIAVILIAVSNADARNRRGGAGGGCSGGDQQQQQMQMQMQMFSYPSQVVGCQTGYLPMQYQSDYQVSTPVQTVSGLNQIKLAPANLDFNLVEPDVVAVAAQSLSNTVVAATDEAVTLAATTQLIALITPPGCPCGGNCPPNCTCGCQLLHSRK